jgi:hypothetical protein
MDVNRKKYVGREFLQRMTASSDRPKAFQIALKDFADSASDNRLDVAGGLLAIGADYSEPSFDRGFALCNDIVDKPNLEHMDQHVQIQAFSDFNIANRDQIRTRALIALTAVNRSVGLQRIDYFIKQYGESEFGRDLRELRKTIGDK